MSAKDSAGDKLIASIQKTKVQAAGGDKPASPAAKPSAKKPAAKKAARKAPAKKAAAPKKTAGTKKSQKEELVRTFQHGRRVWPD